jgi:hypothetical protein
MAMFTAFVVTVASPPLGAIGTAPLDALGFAPACVAYGSPDRCSASLRMLDVCRYAKSRSKSGTRLSKDVTPCEVRRSSIVRASRGRGACVVVGEDGVPGVGCEGPAAAVDCVLGIVVVPLVVVFCVGWD